MPDTMKISFSVSATPKVELINEDGKYQAMTVIHENVRTSVGGAGEITSGDTNLTVNAAWNDGSNTPLASDDTGVDLGVSAATDLLCIRHLGVLASDGTTASESDDTLLIQTKVGDYVIAELSNDEAIILPRPQVDLAIKTGKSPNHVNAQITILGA